MQYTFHDTWHYMATVHFGSRLGLYMSAVRCKCAWATSLDALDGMYSLLHRAGMALVMTSQHALFVRFLVLFCLSHLIWFAVVQGDQCGVAAQHLAIKPV